ncbi:unnamed protein product, partial [Callosobruchus maculatus]
MLFILFIINYLVTVFVDPVFWMDTVKFSDFQCYVGRYFQAFQVNMLILLVVWLCLELWNQFKALNDHLSLFVKRVYLSTGISNICNTINDLDQTTIDCRVLKIKKLKRLHNLLCDILESFNGVFGPIILLEAICAMILIVQYTLEFVYLFVYLKYGLNDIWVTVMVNGLHFIIQSVVKLFALAMVGQLVYGEAHTTIAISYRSINELEATDLPGLHLIKKEFLDLIQQVHIRNPKVIASSFFDVNFSMSGFVIASVTSYIIVALQFMIQSK